MPARKLPRANFVFMHFKYPRPPAQVCFGNGLKNSGKSRARLTPRNKILRAELLFRGGKPGLVNQGGRSASWMIRRNLGPRQRRGEKFARRGPLIRAGGNFSRFRRTCAGPNFPGLPDRPFTDLGKQGGLCRRFAEFTERMCNLG